MILIYIISLYAVPKQQTIKEFPLSFIFVAKMKQNQLLWLEFDENNFQF